MAKKKKNIPQYGTVTRKGVLYYRTRILDADGKQVSLYGTTCEELYDKEQEARRQVAEIIFHREHPTVAEYCEKWLLMQSAKVSPATLKGYASNMKNYIIKPLGDMYMEEVTADDIIDATCKCFSVKREDLIGKRKTREIVEPRQICIYVITELLDLPLSTIGNMFGGRDHTTIMYARDKVAQSLSDSRVKDNVDNIKNMVYKK